MLARYVAYLQKACFGASPNSFLEYTCCGVGVLEVKCPHCIKENNFDVVSKKSSFCLQKSIDGKFNLKKDHPYYYQCQLQLLATSRQYCDLVIWAANDDLHIETITLDRPFIEDKVEKAEKLFWLAVMPGLSGK